MNIPIQSLARLGLITLASLLPSQSHAAQPTPEGIDLFEKTIRPLLVDHCYECHSSAAGKSKGGLLLDHRDGLLNGGDSGPAIVPGKPDDSLLIRAISYTDEELKMPPENKKLSPEQIEHLKHWIQIGAPDPRDAQTKTAPAASLKTEPHWAFQPVQATPVPEITDSDWPRNPIDRFILARLQSKNLLPSPQAEPRTLIRRLYFDLTGLPPTQAEVDRFTLDPSPAAYSKLVDQLLGSAHYGERWARYWLDIARYADTKGYVFTSERRFPFSYTYRDYVVRAFNEDLPFNQFIIEQIAADLLPLGEDKRPLAALGFLTLGRRFLNNNHDIIDDRIDVVTRGTMGLTVSCARCHDHKFDPIPTADYYSLYGIFASAGEPDEQPLLGDSALPQDYPAYLEEKKKREQDRDDYRDRKEEEVRQRIRGQVGDYLMVVHETRGLPDKGARENLVRERKLDPTLAERWQSKLDEWQPKGHPLFTPWFTLAALPSTGFETGAREALANLQTKPASELNPLVLAALSTNVPTSIRETADRYNELFKSINETDPKEPSEHQQAILTLLRGSESPLDLGRRDLARLHPTPVTEKLRDLQRRIDNLESTHPGVPPRAMALADNSSPHDPRIFIRGNPRNQGKPVPRQFLGFIEGPNREPYTNGSGRLQLARAITSPGNPLTARVFVNRVWSRHFGKPLVQTESDFGVRADPPTHPELLDYLTARFIEEGWSIKQLHRLILLSNTYQQSSRNNPGAAKVDPENQLLWRMNRQRLDFEAMRDTLLTVSGRIDLTLGGRSVDITGTPSSTRRTLYGLIERQNLPDLFRTFDFASPDTTSPGRFTTTVPQQALFLLNSPFAIEQARHTASRPEIAALNSNREKVAALYQLAYQRPPGPDELSWALHYLEQPQTENTTLTRLEQYAQTLLVANELFFID